MNGDTTVTVLRAGGRDPHGDRLPGTSHTVSGVTIVPRRSTEDTDRGETIIVGLTIFTAFDVDIRATDQVQIDEQPWAGLYDVVGEPGHWQSPFTGVEAGTEVALSRHG